MANVLLRKRAGAAGGAKRTRPHTKVKSGKERFGQPRNLEEKDVPASEHLRKPRIDIAAHHRRMRDVQNSKFRDALGMHQSSAPGNGCSPIVTREKDLLLPKMIRDSNDIGDQFLQSIRSHAPWFAAEVVSAQVGHNDAKSRGRQRLDLLVPCVPEFRKAVKEHNDGTI